VGEPTKTAGRSLWVRSWLVALGAGVAAALLGVVGALLVDRADLDARMTAFIAFLALYIAVDARWPKPKDGVQ
jgi:zinc transporter ZupT